MVESTVSRSSVELTAWPTSPSARSSPTERVRSRVRACSSLNSRTFSIAITAWSAKVWSNRMSLSANDAGIGARDRDGADDLPLAQHRNARRTTEPCRAGRFLVGVIGVGENVRDLHGNAIPDHACRHSAAAGSNGVERVMLFRARTISGAQVESIRRRKVVTRTNTSHRKALRRAAQLLRTPAERRLASSK